MEEWDAYDAQMHLIQDVTLIRGEPIKDGFFHLVCDILVKHTDGTYLLMQRDAQKSYGGMWEASAGGSALKNESPLTCAQRELYEETGIEAVNLKEIGRLIDADTHTIYVEFLYVTDIDKHSIRLQAGETSAYQWINRDDLCNMGKQELMTRRIWKFMNELQVVEKSKARDSFRILF